MSKAIWIAENLKPGEEYAGIVLGKAGQPDYHLILLAQKTPELTWIKAKKWAESVGGELPTRREQSILFGNLKEQFEQPWHWSCEQHESDPDYAYIQYFYNGDQNYYLKSYEALARAVRRLIIE